MYIKFFKQFLDIIFAIFILIALLPLILLISIIIKLESRGPIFFTQERLGKNGKIFKILKFRSMTNTKYDPNDDIINYYNNPRITKVGKFIRKTSIDEIPQLINVICGKMSLIGPRPPLPYYPKKFEDYTDFEKIRFSVRPGMSGLTQILNRFEDDWSVNILIDIEYVKKISFTTDFNIFIKSLLIFFK